jgi:hypothetical protein
MIDSGKTLNEVVALSKKVFSKGGRPLLNSTAAPVVPHFKTEKNKYEPLFYAEAPSHIHVADKLPTESGCASSLIPLDEFSKQENIQYTAGVHACLELRDSLWGNIQCPKTAIHSINHILTHSYNHLVVAPMGELGKGLFLATDAKPICRGQTVLIYEGVLDANNKKVSEQEILYKYNYDSHKADNPIAEYYKNQDYAIYAGERGGLARYLQCGLGDHELKEMSGLTDAEKKHLPTVNLGQEVVVYLGCPIIIFVALRDIEPGEQLTYSYGDGYWTNQKNIDRKIFDSTGHVIGEIKNNHITIANMNRLCQLPNNKNMSESEKQQLIEKGLPQDQVIYPFDFRKSFINNLKFSIQSYLNRNKNNLGIETFISTLLKAVTNETADQAYENVRKILDDQSSYRAFSDSITPLDKEISYHMSIYYYLRNKESQQSCGLKLLLS